METRVSADLDFITIADAAKLIRAGKLSPVELTEAKLKQIEALDGKLNSFIQLTADAAMADARQAEAEIGKGDWRGPMHGIPIGLKDIYNTAGVTTTAQSAILQDHTPTEDATTVRLLRDAGAIVLGKLTTYEFALGGSSFDLPWPPAHNPWDLTLDPSGSSSGSGAATAAGLCLGAMGSDTGGSIRGPAAWCGLAGIKPTYGLLSRRGILPLSFSLDHAGPLCWTSEDCALMMDAMAAHDPFDVASADPGPIDFAGALGQSLKGVRVGVVRHFFEEEVQTDAEVVVALEAALAALRDAGAAVKDVRMAPFAEYNATGTLISRGEAFAIHEHWLKTSPEKYGAYARLRLMQGAFIAASDFVNAMRHRGRLIQAYATLMKEVDILVFPTASGVAEPLGADSMAAPVARSPFFNRVFNVLGGPAHSICSGFSAAGLPLALQIAGRPFEDARVLAVGHMLQQALGTRGRRPDVAGAAAAPAPTPAALPDAPPSDAFVARMDALGLPRLSTAEMATLEGMAAGIGGAAALLQGERHYAEEPPNALSLTPPVYGPPASA